MAVRTKDEIMAAIRERIGDDISDEAIALIEDVADTYDDLTNKAADYVELESKYNELDSSWRERYKARFYETGNLQITNDPIPQIDDPVPDPVEEEITTFEELFKED